MRPGPYSYQSLKMPCCHADGLLSKIIMNPRYWLGYYGTAVFVQYSGIHVYINDLNTVFKDGAYNEMQGMGCTPNFDIQHEVSL